MSWIFAQIVLSWYHCRNINLFNTLILYLIYQKITKQHFMMFLHIFNGPTDYVWLFERYQNSVQVTENFTSHLFVYNPCGAPSYIVTVLSICPHLRREAKKTYTSLATQNRTNPPGFHFSSSFHVLRRLCNSLHTTFHFPFTQLYIQIEYRSHLSTS